MPLSRGNLLENDSEVNPEGGKTKRFHEGERGKFRGHHFEALDPAVPEVTYPEDSSYVSQ